MIFMFLLKTKTLCRVFEMFLFLFLVLFWTLKQLWIFLTISLLTLTAAAAAATTTTITTTKNFYPNFWGWLPVSCIYIMIFMFLLKIKDPLLSLW